MNYIFIDVESYYSRKDKYDLKSLSIMEYIRDSRFKAHGLGWWLPGKGAGWLSSSLDLTQELRQVDWANTAVVAHNVKFDGAILAWKYNVKPAMWLDTKALSLAIFGKTIPSHSLKDLASHFGFPPKGEMKTDGVRDLTPEQEKELADYCLRDVEICKMIWDKLSTGFPADQLWHMDWTNRAFIEPSLVLNQAKLEEAHKNEKARRAAFFPDAETKTKFASNQQFAAMLTEKGYDVPTKKSLRTGKAIPALGTGDAGFIALAEGASDELRGLIDARIAAKSTLLETRTAKLAAIAKTGPWAFDVGFSGASQTHRYSGGGAGGGNPQNFTKDSVLREAVEAPPGYNLIVGDFSRVELVIQTFLSRDVELMKSIEQGEDIYCAFGTRFFGRPITKADEDERFFAKTAVLGLGYGMGAKRFIQTVKKETGKDITQHEAEKVVKLYRQVYFGIPRLWYMLEDFLPSIAAGESGSFSNMSGGVTYGDHSIILPSGLKIKYPNLRSTITAKSHREWVFDAYSHKKSEVSVEKIYGGKMLENICQGLAGELCKEAIARASTARHLLVRVVGAVHDEILVVCPGGGFGKPAAEYLRGAMETPPPWFPELKLGAEIGIGSNWKEAKK